MKVLQTELAIMGSGLAGLTAAVRARRAGIDVAVFEKRPFQGGAISNTPMMTLSVRPEKEFQEKAFRTHMEYNNWNANPAAVRSWIKYSSQIPGFITRELGLSFEGEKKTKLEEFGQLPGYGAGFPNAFNIGDYYYLKPIGKGHGAAVICKKMADLFVKEGGKLYFNTQIKKLIKEDGKVIGAVAYDRKNKEEVIIEAKAVVVASGGFSDNKEMLQELLNHKLTNNNADDGSTVTFNHFNNGQMMGDGLNAVWEIGGARGGVGINTGLLVPGPGVRGDNVPWIQSTQITTVQEQPYLWVNKYGERYFCEEKSDQHMVTYTVVNNQPGKEAFMIFDADTLHRLETKGVDKEYFIFNDKIKDLHAQFERVIKQGNKHVFIADSIEELCQMTGIVETGLKATLERYNRFCDEGYDEDFFKNPEWLLPVRKPTFYAIRTLCCGYHAFGGIRINGKCEVLDTNQRPIPGLYSAGDCCVSELYGNPPIGGIGISSASFSHGFICADETSKYIKHINQ